LQISVLLLSEDRQSQKMQKMLRESVSVLKETDNPMTAAFLVTTVCKIDSPTDGACTGAL
jgi:cell division protein FtsX